MNEFERFKWAIDKTRKEMRKRPELSKTTKKRINFWLKRTYNYYGEPEKEVKKK